MLHLSQISALQKSDAQQAGNGDISNKNNNIEVGVEGFMGTFSRLFSSAIHSQVSTDGRGSSTPIDDNQMTGVAEPNGNTLPLLVSNYIDLNQQNDDIAMVDQSSDLSEKVSSTTFLPPEDNPFIQVNLSSFRQFDPIDVSAKKEAPGLGGRITDPELPFSPLNMSPLNQSINNTFNDQREFNQHVTSDSIQTVQIEKNIHMDGVANNEKEINLNKNDANLAIKINEDTSLVDKKSDVKLLNQPNLEQLSIRSSEFSDNRNVNQIEKKELEKNIWIDNVLSDKKILDKADLEKNVSDKFSFSKKESNNINANVFSGESNLSSKIFSDKKNEQQFLKQSFLQLNTDNITLQRKDLDSITPVLPSVRGNESSVNSEFNAVAETNRMLGLSESGDLKSMTKLNSGTEFTQGLNLKQNLAPNLALRVQWMFKQAMSSAEILLDPPEMGPLSVKVQQHNGETNIMFQVSNQQAKELLAENLPKLKEMLEESGLSLGEAQVEQRESSDSKEQKSNDKNTASHIADNIDPVNSPENSHQTINMHLVDTYS